MYNEEEKNANIEFMFLEDDNIEEIENVTVTNIEEGMEPLVIDMAKPEVKEDKNADKINILLAKVLYVNQSKKRTYLDFDGKEISIMGIYHKEYMEVQYTGNSKKKYEIISVK